SVHLGLDVGWGPDPEQPHRIIFSFGGDVGSPDLGLGVGLRLTGEEPHPGWYQRGPETELYGRFTRARRGSCDAGTGLGPRWEAVASLSGRGWGAPGRRGRTEVHPRSARRRGCGRPSSWGPASGRGRGTPGWGTTGGGGWSWGWPCSSRGPWPRSRNLSH